MSADREKKQRFVVSGYIRKISDQYKIDMPSEIVSIIFIFYYIKFFTFEHSEKIQVKNNIIRNINDDEDSYDFLNTTVIGDWMDSDSEYKHIHTIRLKIIRMVEMIIVGIVGEFYDVEDDMESGRFAWESTGRVRDDHVDSYGVRDEIFMILNFKELSLSYKIIKPDNTELNGVLFGSQQIDKDKYKWAVSTDDRSDCVEILDIY